MRYQVFAPLLLLQALNLWWYYAFIFRTAVQYVSFLFIAKRKADGWGRAIRDVNAVADDRSDDEDDEEEDAVNGKED